MLDFLFKHARAFGARTVTDGPESDLETYFMRGRYAVAQG
jgi:hypothetical protein